MQSFRVMAVIGLIPILAASAPASAQRWSGPSQYERGYYPWHTPRSEAISRSTIAETADANEQAAAEIGDGWYVDEDRYAEDQARYAADMRDYYADRRDAAQDYARRRRAHAAAMRDWYAQTRACEQGDRRACDAPPPDPADYE